MGRIDDALKRASAAKSAGLPAASRLSVVSAAPTTMEDYPIEQPAPQQRSPLPEPPVANVAVAPAVHREPAVRRETAVHREAVVHREAQQVPRETSHRIRIPETLMGKLVTTPTAPVSAIEEFRRLAVTLRQVRLERTLKVVMVASAAPLEGKTMTSVNLALTLSESYKYDTLIIDGDLRHPSVHNLLGIPAGPGLRETLRTESAAAPFMRVAEHLSLLQAGRVDDDDNSGFELTTNRMSAILADASQRFDWIIIDSPPVGIVSDAKMLAPLADGILVVIGAGSTDYRLAEQAIAELGPERVAGVVLNRAEARVSAATSHHYYHKRPAPPEHNER
jgi:capsular exopolysaccharide synthesis family protein